MRRSLSINLLGMIARKRENMRITLEIPDDMVEAIDEEITMNSHNECGDGPLPAEGAWAIFQGLWGDALEDARAAPNA